MFTVMLVALPAVSARAENEVPEAGAVVSPGLKFKTERVVVFKDGYGLFVKHATGVVGADGRLHTDEVPPAAVLGTFWATADKHDIVSMKAEWVEQKSSSAQVIDCVSKADLLRANEGKPLALEMNYGQTITGKLLDVLEIPPAPDGSGAGGGQLAVMQTPAGTKILPIGSVRTITGDDLVTRMTRRREAIDRTKRLWFDLGPQAAGSRVTLRLFYFTAGIRWIPTYRLGGELKYDGQLSLQGEILNEVEDIDAAVLDLVVGVPNFRSEWRGNEAPHAQAGGRDAAVLAAELTAAGEQDLFVYTFESLTLAKGARATVALWSSSVPLRHLYTMEVGVVRDFRSGARIGRDQVPNDPGNRSPLRLAHNKVWHQLELTNTADVPWTTGPAMLLRSFLPLGQELLTYTPRGGRTLLPITVAVDVRGTHEEEEIDRKPKALRWGSYEWAHVRKKGTVTVTNYRDEPADMLISVNTGGKVESASDDGTIKINATRVEDWFGGHAAINNHSDVAWSLTLEPGETRTVSYVVSYYVR
jgi:hypothetical protein